ncbi:unnamed protein product, partial [marine sediment metagenome]
NAINMTESMVSLAFLGIILIVGIIILRMAFKIFIEM